jgi:quercetin dioxygenase-like cupin family protein
MSFPLPDSDASADVALYVAGALTGEEKRNVEARLQSGCAFCLAQAAAFDRAAGEALAAFAPAVVPPPSLKDRLMGSLKSPAEPNPARVVRAGEAGWRPGPVTGSRVKPLLGRSTFLLELAPGATFPAHDHDHGAEQCLVISGSVRSGETHVEAGDYVFMPRGSHHEPLETSDGCVLLIAYS